MEKYYTLWKFSHLDNGVLISPFLSTLNSIVFLKLPFFNLKWYFAFSSEKDAKYVSIRSCWINEWIILKRSITFSCIDRSSGFSFLWILGFYYLSFISNRNVSVFEIALRIISYIRNMITRMSIFSANFPNFSFSFSF